MGLRLIYGRAGSGKSRFCLAGMLEGLQKEPGRKQILIVPEQFSLQAEQSLVRTLGAGGLNGAEVLSFRRMTYRVFSEAGGITRKPLGAAGKCILVYRAMDMLREKLKVYAGAAGQKGFVNTLCGTISELKRYQVSPGQLADLSREAEGQLAEKLHDIALIYDAFEKAMLSGCFDGDDILTLLAQKLDVCRLFEGAEIWMDEFSGFTPQEYTVIEKLLKTAARVNIALCTDYLEDEAPCQAGDPFGPARAAAAKLKHLAKDAGVSADTPVAAGTLGYTRFVRGPGGSGALGYLEKNLYAYTGGIYRDAVEDIRIFAAANIYEEVENAAVEIVRLCRERGLRYRDMAVVTGNLPLYEGFVKAIFKEFGIPCFIDRKRDINGHPLILLLLSALQIQAANWSYEAVFRYLKTGLTGIERDDVDCIENYVLAYGIKGYRWKQEGPWEHGADEDPGLLDRVNAIRGRVTGPLLRLHQGLGRRGTGKSYATLLYDFLCELNIPQRMEMLTGLFTEKGELGLAMEYGQIWRMVMGLFDQVAEVVGEAVISPDKFLELLSLGLGECKLGLIPPSLEQVLVGSIERSKSHEVKALLILGVNDGCFPTPFKDDGILSDLDRSVLRARGVELAQDTRERTFEQQHLVYTALTTPSSYLYLSYAVSDNEGKALRPSMVVSRLKRLFPGLAVSGGLMEGNARENELEWITTPAPTFNRMVTSLGREAKEGKISEVWRETYGWFIGNTEWREQCRQVLSGFRYSNQVEPLDEQRVRKLYGNSIYTSVSRLERFASCPFSYYVQYGLNARERKVLKLTAPDLGSFLHLVLDRFAETVGKSGRKWRQLERQWCAEKVSEIVDELLNQLKGNVFSNSGRYRYLAERLKRVLTRSVWLIAEHIRRGSFEPLGHELAFGIGEEMPSIVIELPTGDNLVLNGRVDRLDTLKTESGTYLRIIDYKSGSKQFKLSDVYYGLQIQLVAYLDAVGRNLQAREGGPVLPAGMLYFRLDDPIVAGGRGLTDEAIEKAIMKELKMKGLLLADVKLVKEMDGQIDGESAILPVRLNKGDVLGKSSAAVTLEQFEQLKRHVRKLMVKFGEEMYKGNIAISPYRRKRTTSCSYCSFGSVCQFDAAVRGNRYRIQSDRKDDAVWEEIGKAEEGGEAVGQNAE